MTQLDPKLQSIRETVRSYVLDQLDRRGISEIRDDASLLEAGVVDSLGIFQMIAYLEAAFSIHIADQEIALTHFETIEVTTRFVASKQGLS